MALNENAVKREQYKIDRTEETQKAATNMTIGFASVHAPSADVKGPSAPHV
jgi:hypothetical protein